MNFLFKNIWLASIIMLIAGCATENVSKQNIDIKKPPPRPAEIKKTEDKTNTIPEPEPKKVEHIYHRIMEGETLGVISQWYCGTTKLWKIILKENPHVNPSNLKVGDILKIPLAIATLHHDQPSTPLSSTKENKEAVFGPK